MTKTRLACEIYGQIGHLESKCQGHKMVIWKIMHIPKYEHCIYNVYRSTVIGKFNVC